MTLTTLFLDQLADRYNAEKRLAFGMPTMIKAATGAALQALLLTHLEMARRHLKTLEQVFGSFGERLWTNRPATTTTFLAEAHAAIVGLNGRATVDAGIISILQKTAESGITSYACLRDQAAVLKKREAAGMLNEILVEERGTKQALIAYSGLNARLEMPRDSKDALQHLGDHLWLVSAQATESLNHFKVSIGPRCALADADASSRWEFQQTA